MEKPVSDTQKPRKQKEPRAPLQREEGDSEFPAKDGGNLKDSPKRQGGRPPRNEDWKIELEKSVSLDTKVPALPKEEDMLKKPDQNAFKLSMEKLNKKVEKLFAEMDEIKKHERDLREDIFAKNNAEFVELRKLGDQRKELSAKLEVSKKAKEEIKAQIAVLEEKRSKLEKKGVNGRVLPKEKLEEIIAEKERDYKNSLKTSADEKRYLEEISRLKESMPLVAEINKLQVQIDALYKKQKDITAPNKPIVEQLDALRKKADVLRGKLGLADKKEEGEKTEEKKEKPKRELTQEEKDLQTKRQQLFDQVTKLKDQKSDLYARYQKENDAYFKQQDDVYKIKFMTSVLKRLKHAESQRKWEADKDKRQQEELDRVKAKAATKFNEDIEICENLVTEVEQIRLREKMRNEGFGGASEAKADFKVDDKLLKEANLVMLKPKKDESEGVQPGQRKQGKKNKKAEVTSASGTEQKLDIPSATLTSLAKLGIAVPNDLNELDKIVELVAQKKEGFVKSRDEAIAKAEAQLKAGAEEEGVREAQELERNLSDTEEKPAKTETPKKNIKLDDASFPALE
jgi:hypothetical protein